MLITPVLFIVYNRPETTKEVFEVIREQKPMHLFVAADGPRPEKNDDHEKCMKVRELINVDWNCNLHLHYRDINLGCGKGPSDAITWFFNNVTEGIILEDDCIPHPHFFSYCRELLEYFRENDKIFFIGGTNFQKGILRGSGSYYYSAGFQGTWGWATWKRTWDNFDYYMNKISEDKFREVVNKMFTNGRQKDYWMEIFREVKRNRFNESCWDYQFYFTNWALGKMAIIPNVNLVRNIGFGVDATHTVGNNIPSMNLQSKSIMPLIHNKNIILDKKADLFAHKHYIQAYEFGMKGLIRLPMRLNKKIKSFLKIKGSWL